MGATLTDGRRRHLLRRRRRRRQRPLEHGYDDYGSLGAYTLAKTGCDGSAPTGDPSAPTAPCDPHATDPSVTLSWGAPTTAGNGAVTGYLLARSGSDDVAVLPARTRVHVDRARVHDRLHVRRHRAQRQGAGPLAPSDHDLHRRRSAGARRASPRRGTLGQRGLFAFAPRRRPPARPRCSTTSTSAAPTPTPRSARARFSGFQPAPHVRACCRQRPRAGPVSQVTTVAPPTAANDAFAQRDHPQRRQRHRDRQQPRVLGRVQRARAPRHARPAPARPRSGTRGPRPRPVRRRSARPRRSPAATPPSPSTPGPRSAR